MSKQSQEIQDHVMTVNMEARNLSETKLRGRLLALKYRVKQGSSFQGLSPSYPEPDPLALNHTVQVLTEWSIPPECTDPFFLSSCQDSPSLHAVAIASAQKNKGSLEDESIVRAASTKIQFCLSTMPLCSGVWGVDV
ncbi:hypothetical protein Tco_1576367 [Tanacetum coccineum]